MVTVPAVSTATTAAVAVTDVQGSYRLDGGFDAMEVRGVKASTAAEAAAGTICFSSDEILFIYSLRFKMCCHFIYLEY